MLTTGPFIALSAPFPFEMVMPESLIDRIAPEAVLITIPPAGPEASLRAMQFCCGVCKTMDGCSGSPASARAGTSPEDANQKPVHTGFVRSPSSNSTQTPVPISGNVQTPIWRPAQGKLGSAHSAGVDPIKLGTFT